MIKKPGGQQQAANHEVNQPRHDELPRQVTLQPVRRRHHPAERSRFALVPHVSTQALGDQEDRHQQYAWKEQEREARLSLRPYRILLQFDLNGRREEIRYDLLDDPVDSHADGGDRLVVRTGAIAFRRVDQVNDFAQLLAKNAMRVEDCVHLDAQHLLHDTRQHGLCGIRLQREAGWLIAEHRFAKPRGNDQQGARFALSNALFADFRRHGIDPNPLLEFSLLERGQQHRTGQGFVAIHNHQFRHGLRPLRPARPHGDYRADHHWDSNPIEKDPPVA